MSWKKERPKEEPRSRTNRTSVGLNTDERERIKANAAACRLTISSYLRLLGLGYEPKSKIDASTRLELAKLRSELGQLRAFWLSQQPEGLGGPTGPADLAALVQKIGEVERLVLMTGRSLDERRRA